MARPLPPSLVGGDLEGAEFALCLAVPFFFSGVVVSLALTRSPYPIGQVYGADLIGAATGCIGVLALLNVMSGPSAVLWVGGSSHSPPSPSPVPDLAPQPNPRRLVPSYFATAEASSQGAYSWRLPTRSRAMAYPTDHHQGSLGSTDRPCLRSLEFIFPHHRQSEPNGTAVDVRRLAAHAGLDHRAASAEY